ncbi:MAG: hypothetical protein WC661_04865 [Opitutaceae bacterium]
MAALVLAFLTLLWPGWPLHPLATLASWRARSQGLELHVRSPWLRLHTDLTLSLNVKSVRVGDPANRDALALENLSVSWRLYDLIRARWSPESIRLDEAAATLRADADRRLQFIALPSAPAGAPASAFTPADLPANLLPREGRAFNLTIARTRLSLPAGLPVAKVTTGPVALTLGQHRAGYLDFAGSLDLKVDDRPGAAQFEGQLALARDWLGRLKATLNAAPGADAPATRIAFDAARADATKPASVSLRINDCAPGDWLALLKRADLPKITGRFDAEFEATGDPVRRHLDAASVRINTGAFTLAHPALLVRPLAVTPVRLAFRTEDNGDRGTLDPFAAQAGPLALNCSGMTWSSKGATVSGNGNLQLGAVPLSALLEWLPPAVLAKLPLTATEASEIGLAATTVTLAATGERTAAPPRLRVSTRTGLTLNQETVAIESEAGFDPATKKFNVQVALPDFVQARWQLALLRRFPVPELAAPLRAEFSVNGRWPATLDDARWRIVAGEGHVIPRGPSLRWLARPFPITSFALSGRLDNDQKKLAVDQLDFVSGRAHLAFERTELQSPQALITTSGAAPATARFALKLEHWYAADFIPLLGSELQSMVAPAADDLAQIGLERLETGAELSFARLPWIDPTLTALNGTQSAVFRIGEERLPVDAVWKFDPATRRIAATVHLEGLRPDRLKLASLKTAPVPPSVLDLAFAVNLDVSANPYAQSLDLMNLKADLRVQADGGRIKANPYLAADLPVKHLALAASARILPLRLDHLKAEADFGGPTLVIDDARLDLGDGGRGGVRLSLRELPLDWALARVPAAWIPAPLKDARVRGRLAKLDLNAGFPSPTAKETKPLPDVLTIAMDLRDLALRLDNRPELTLPRLDVSGDLRQFDIRIDRASTDGINLVNFTANVTTPMSPARQAKAAGTVETDLARVPALLAAAKPWVTIPAGVDLAGLGGQATLQFTASAPLAPAKIPTDLKAGVTVTARQVTLPMVPANIRIGPSAFTLAADVTGQTATGTFAWQPSSLDVAPWISGAPSVSATYTATPQTIDLHAQTSLDATVMDVPPLAWRKAVGLPAKIFTDARFTLPTPTAAGHIAATVTTEGLIISPLSTRAEVALSDDKHPPLNLLPGIASLQLRDTRFGLSSLDLDATRAPDGATRLALRSPLIDLSAWITRFSDAIIAWNKAQVPPPVTTPATVVVKPAPAPPSPPAATAIPLLDLPALDIQADIARIALTPASDLTRVSLAATLRDGLPASLKLTASADEKTTLDLQLDPAAGRDPWHCNLVNLTGWLRAAAAPLPLLTSGPLPADSPLETLRTLPATFVSGDISLQGTADWRDLKNTVDGSFHIDRLALENEVKFLSKIAALVKKRVILHVPFKVFDVPSFTASPTSVSLKKMRIEGPLTLTSEHLDLDLVKSEIDMSGKVLGIGFDVAGPLADPRFFLTEKNLLFKGVTTQDDFDF